MNHTQQTTLEFLATTMAGKQLMKEPTYPYLSMCVYLPQPDSI
jgi:hypothetical protein